MYICTHKSDSVIIGNVVEFVASWQDCCLMHNASFNNCIIKLPNSFQVATLVLLMLPKH